jgi:hypothetical protein
LVIDIDLFIGTHKMGDIKLFCDYYEKYENDKVIPLPLQPSVTVGNQQFLYKMKCYAIGMNRILGLFLSIILIVVVVLIPLPETSNTIFAQEEGCVSCHSSFKAFTMTLDAPREVPENYDFEYKVIVGNPGEHELQNVEAVLDISGAPNLEFAQEGGEPYHEETSGSVSAGGSTSISFPILAGATDAEIILDGDEGFLGRNDIDLTVNSPNGQSWESAGSGADEAINLDARDFDRGGYGDYEAVIVYFIGPPSISFTLTVDVQYGVGQMRLEGPDLAPGEKHTFTWPLRSTTKGDNTVEADVSGTAYHEHGEVEAENSEDYSEEETRELTVGDKLVYSAPDEEVYIGDPTLLIERTLGILSALILIISIAFTRILKPVQVRVDKLMGGVAKRVKWHCRISLLLLLLSGLHGILLPIGPHASSLRGLYLGVPSFVIMGILGYIGWQQQKLKMRWGNEKWRRIHLILTIMVLIFVALHAFLDGTDFAWLRT